MRITFLGTGTSHGIPVIGCHCPVCLSQDPRNQRGRLGVWLHDAQHSFLIDVSSEFRQGALRHGIDKMDAVFLTHSHTDHVSGLDDLRIFSQITGMETPIYGNSATLSEIRNRFSYAFDPPKAYGGGVPRFDLRCLEEPIEIVGWKITGLPIWHGPDAILGFRVQNFALITDVTTIPETTLGLLQGLKVLVLDCLRDNPHSTHLCFQEAVRYAQQINAEKTFFIHMGHDLEHVETESRLPDNIRLSYDGLEIEIA